MKKLVAIFAFTILIAVAPQVIASTITIQTVKTSDIVEHGGGCRKDSPQGRCCHAGSKPYHCH